MTGKGKRKKEGGRRENHVEMEFQKENKEEKKDTTCDRNIEMIQYHRES